MGFTYGSNQNIINTLGILEKKKGGIIPSVETYNWTTEEYGLTHSYQGVYCHIYNAYQHNSWYCGGRQALADSLDKSTIMVAKALHRLEEDGLIIAHRMMDNAGNPKRNNGWRCLTNYTINEEILPEARRRLVSTPLAHKTPFPSHYTHITKGKYIYKEVDNIIYFNNSKRINKINKNKEIPGKDKEIKKKLNKIKRQKREEAKERIKEQELFKELRLNGRDKVIEDYSKVVPSMKVRKESKNELKDPLKAIYKPGSKYWWEIRRTIPKGMKKVYTPSGYTYVELTEEDDWYSYNCNPKNSKFVDIYEQVRNFIRFVPSDKKNNLENDELCRWGREHKTFNQLEKYILLNHVVGKSYSDWYMLDTYDVLIFARLWGLSCINESGASWFLEKKPYLLLTNPIYAYCILRALDAKTWYTKESAVENRDFDYYLATALERTKTELGLENDKQRMNRIDTREQMVDVWDWDGKVKQFPETEVMGLNKADYWRYYPFDVAV